MTTTPDIADQVRKIVSRELRADLDRCTDDAHLDGLGADHIDVVGIIVDIEDDLHLPIDDAASIDAAQTVGDLIALAIAGAAVREAA